MNRLMLKGVVSALFSFSAVLAHAGYAQLSPPPGWSQGAYGGQFAYGSSANSATLSNGTIRTNAGLNVGGRAISVPASMRFAANAPRVAAAAIFLSPHLRAAVGIAAWLGLGKVVWDEVSGTWKTPDSSYPLSDGKAWWTYDIGFTSNSPEEACARVAGGAAIVTGPFDGGLTMGCSRKLPSGSVEWVTTMRWTTNTKCPSGWYVTPAGCVQTPPLKQLDQQELVEKLAPHHMPDSVPQEMPNVPLPVDVPIVNPIPLDSPDGLPTPIFVPTGNPIPNPNYDPNAQPGPNNMPWLQPGFRVTPQPVPWSPWQVDIRPVNRPVPTPAPNWQPYPDPWPNPWDQPDPSRDETEDFCIKNPASIICEKGDVSDKELPKVPKLYERKYPDGLVGIWNEKKEAFMSSGLGTLAGAMMPTGLQTGSCPSFQMNLSFAAWADYGVNDLSPPCWVWDFAKVVVLISAVILARQLIFGG